ncbi:MAG: hypothetical protein FGM57_03855 [Candidatus Taylorbacteria bacterium]|nr:hypothetical protein [Candidatus Taylorbacteria bacterium]
MKLITLIGVLVTCTLSVPIYNHFSPLKEKKEKAELVRMLRNSLALFSKGGLTPAQGMKIVEDLRFYIRDEGYLTSEDLGMRDLPGVGSPRHDWIGRLELIVKMRISAISEKKIIDIQRLCQEKHTRPTKSQIESMDTLIVGMSKTTKMLKDKKGLIAFTLGPIDGDDRTIVFDCKTCPTDTTKAIKYRDAAVSKKSL